MYDIQMCIQVDVQPSPFPARTESMQDKNVLTWHGTACIPGNMVHNHSH